MTHLSITDYHANLLNLPVEKGLTFGIPPLEISTCKICPRKFVSLWSKRSGSGVPGYQALLLTWFSNLSHFARSDAEAFDPGLLILSHWPVLEFLTFLAITLPSGPLIFKSVSLNLQSSPFLGTLFLGIVFVILELLDLLCWSCLKVFWVDVWVVVVVVLVVPWH